MPANTGQGMMGPLEFPFFFIYFTRLVSITWTDNVKKSNAKLNNASIGTDGQSSTAIRPTNQTKYLMPYGDKQGYILRRMCGAMMQRKYFDNTEITLISANHSNWFSSANQKGVLEMNSNVRIHSSNWNWRSLPTILQVLHTNGTKHEVKLDIQIESTDFSTSCNSLHKSISISIGIGRQLRWYKISIQPSHGIIQRDLIQSVELVWWLYIENCKNKVRSIRNTLNWMALLRKADADARDTEKSSWRKSFNWE